MRASTVLLITTAIQIQAQQFPSCANAGLGLIPMRMRITKISDAYVKGDARGDYVHDRSRCTSVTDSEGLSRVLDRARGQGDGSAVVGDVQPGSASVRECLQRSRLDERGIMHAQLITYRLNDISEAEYLEQMVQPDAPVLANVPGQPA